MSYPLRPTRIGPFLRINLRKAYVQQWKQEKQKQSVRFINYTQYDSVVVTYYLIICINIVNEFKMDTQEYHHIETQKGDIQFSVTVIKAECVIKGKPSTYS